MTIDEWGLTNKGFYCPTYEEILISKIDKAKELFGENICTDNNSPLGKFIRVETAYDHKLFEELEKVYYSISPATATGVSLDRAVSFARVTRNTAVPAKHKIRLYGTLNHSVPKGTLVRSTGGVTFYTTTDCVISEYDGIENDMDMYYADVEVQCTSAGTLGNVYDINSLVDVDTDVMIIEYIETITPGIDTETDVELSNRYNSVVDGLGVNTKNAIKSALMKINGVHDVEIVENVSGSDVVVSDDLAIDSGTYAVIVYANSGLDDEIAEAIFNHKPFGIKQSGNETVQVKDDAEEVHDVIFSYTKELAANIKVECTVNSKFAATGANDIRENISQAVNKLEIGEQLVFTRLYEKIYSVPGIVEVTSLTVNDDISSLTAKGDEIVKVGTITVSTTEV